MRLASSNVEFDVSDLEIRSFFKDSGPHLEERHEKLVLDELEVNALG